MGTGKSVVISFFHTHQNTCARLYTGAGNIEVRF